LLKALEVAGLALFGGLHVEGHLLQALAFVVKLVLDAFGKFVEVGAHLRNSVCRFNPLARLRFPASRSES
jgi:hypothetical protein